MQVCSLTIRKPSSVQLEEIIGSLADAIKPMIKMYVICLHSSVIERFVDIEEVVGLIPTAGTISKLIFRWKVGTLGPTIEN